MDRRQFLKTAGAGAALAALSDFQTLFAKGTYDKWVGRPWKGWERGEFQVHFIYTGVGESMFMIFPDGTSMLLDCGDHDVVSRSQARGRVPLPLLPGGSRHAGEWIARYVQRVNPGGNKVDYMMLSHYHIDHGGGRRFYSGIKPGTEDYRLSGFSEAAEYLSFGKAFDRCYPQMKEPIPLGENVEESIQMRQFYDFQTRERGMKVEQLRLGAEDQIVMLKDPSAFGSFKIRNISANGRIALRDGTIRDLYADRIAKTHPKSLNENGMSQGIFIKYGPFSFYTAGDFSDSWKDENGVTHIIEEEMADAVWHADVAKLNHHGYLNSMPRKLVKALSARVWVSCVWDQPHTAPPTLETLSDRSLYPGDRIICPTCFTAQRRDEDAGKPGVGDICESAFDGGHIVLNVEKGGKAYSISYLTAVDESMKVKSVMRFIP